MAVTRMFGVSVKRREDARMMTGRAHYTDDVRLSNMSYVAVVRSPYAHARIKSIDAEKAKSMPGVIDVLTGQDLENDLGPVPCAWLPANCNLKVPEYRAIATDRVRYVGDEVAVVVAESRYQAEDAAGAVHVEYEPLDVVTRQEDAIKDGAPQLYDDVPNNLAYTWELAGGDFDSVWEQSEVKLSQRFVNHRLIANAMETRGAVADYNSGTGEMTIWVTSQNPHIHRFLFSVVTGIPESKLRVISTDVGGGFGSKIPMYSGELIACAVAKRLGRPVKWMEDRRENYLTNAHGRDHVDYVDVAATKDGNVTGIRVKAYANHGAYLSTAAPGVPTWLFATMLSGPYKIPNIDCTIYGVLTNTTTTDAYRGAGRPEATYLLERVMDLLANELGLDPTEIRRRNFIGKDEFPYTVATTLQYDSGDYEAALNRALEIVGYDDLRAEQERLRAEGRYLGIGFSTYVEVCGLAPSHLAGFMGFQGGLWESAKVRMHPTGKVTAFTGASPHGQGEETTFAQLVSDELGVPFDDIEIIHGDTGMIQFGWGTYGSRSTAVGGSALVYASRKLIEKAKKFAAHMLEASPEEIVFDQGNFYVQGSPEPSKSIQEVALQAYLAWDIPKDVEPALEESYFFDPTNFTFPFGTHICVVEIDSDTGSVDFTRYVAVDDVGNVINPMIVDGQIHGGIAQGLAQVVYEHAEYDEGGQLVTGTMMDYAVPKAHQVPTFELDRTVTPTPVNPMGLKGVGETGTIASTPAVANAIMDALKPLGVTHVDMPLTPQRIWEVIQERKGS
jgi:aerobic carbon-monoxide dehydrogenase large subunit